MGIDVGGNILSSSGFDSSGNIVNSPSIVTDGLVLWIDAGYLVSYNNTSNYYDCGYGCQYYASDPGCTNCNTQVKDMSGYGNDGVLQNGVYVEYSNVGGTILFDGTNDYISMVNSTTLDTQTPTVETWIKTNATTQNGFFFEKGSVNTEYSLFQEGGSICWRQGGLSQYTTTATYINTSNWAHIVGTFVSGDRRTYINGVCVNSDTQTGTVGTNSGGMTIGCYGGGGYMYNGRISTVRVYTKVLSATEVLQNFNEGRQRFGI